MYDSVTGELKYHDGTTVKTVGSGGGGGSGTVTSITAGSGLTGGTITTSGTIALEDVGTPGTYFKVTTDAKGRVVSGATSLVEADLPNITTPGRVSGDAITSGTIGGNTSINTTGSITSSSVSTRYLDLYDSDSSNRIRFQTPSILTNDYTLTWPTTAGSSGQVLTTDGSGNLTWSSSVAPSGSAGGDLAGTYPNPQLVTLHSGGTGTKITYDAKGRVTGSASLDASDIPALDWSKITTGKPTTLDGYGITDAVKNAGGVPSLQSGLDADKPATAQEGEIYVAWDTQKIYRHNGSSWVVIAGAGAAGTITNVTAQTPLTSTGGAAPEISIPKASATTDGYLSKEDWSAFNSKLSTDLEEGKFFVGDGSNKAQAVAASGDVSLEGSGKFMVTGLHGREVDQPSADRQVLIWDQFAGKYVSGYITLYDIRSSTVPTGSVFPATACGAHQTLTWNSPLDTFTCQDIAIASTQVTDLGSMALEDRNDYLTKTGNLAGLSDPSAARANLGMTATGDALVTAADASAARAAIHAMPNVTPGTNGNVLTVSGGNWVSAPLSITAANFGNQMPNHVLAGPASGGSGTPAFRALVVEDIPNLDASKIASGQLDIARIPTGTTGATVALGNDPRIVNAVQKTGDSMSGLFELPANGLKVGGDQLVVSGSNVGIGTATPATKLDVSGGVKVGNESTCNASKAGTIRWTGTAFQGCNGTTWISLTGGGGGGITSCPSGWTMIGDPGKHATFCIQTNENSTSRWHNAITNCSAINDSTLGRAHLCTYYEWRMACERGTGLVNMTNNWEWVADVNDPSPDGDIDLAVTAGGGGCTRIEDFSVTEYYNYRCCIR